MSKMFVRLSLNEEILLRISSVFSDFYFELSIKSKDPVSFYKRFSCIFPNYITAEARQGRDGKGNRPAVVVF